MTNTSNIQPKSNNQGVTEPQKLRQNLQQRFNSFIMSLSEALKDMTALEVNTMVVAEITASKFIPEEAYQYIYAIPIDERESQYFIERQIPSALYPRYRSLRQKLLMEYRQMLLDPSCELSDPQERLPDPGNPKDQKKLQYILDSGRFLRGLRKLIELKSALDSGELSSETTDIIYAQTIMQLDGDIINRYHEKLLESDFREVLVRIHNEGVMSGERQWRGLLGFMVDLVQMILQKSKVGITLPISGNQLSGSQFTGNQPEGPF